MALSGEGWSCMRLEAGQTAACLELASRTEQEYGSPGQHPGASVQSGQGCLALLLCWCASRSSWT